MNAAQRRRYTRVLDHTFHPGLRVVEIGRSPAVWVVRQRSEGERRDWNLVFCELEDKPFGHSCCKPHRLRLAPQRIDPDLAAVTWGRE